MNPCREYTGCRCAPCFCVMDFIDKFVFCCLIVQENRRELSHSEKALKQQICDVIV